MNWLMEYVTEDEDLNHQKNVNWATSWQEVMGHFMSWISPDSEVIKGQITCYWGDKPYGNGKPCLQYNALPFDMDEDEN